MRRLRMRMKRMTLRNMRSVGMMSVEGRLKRIIRMKKLRMRNKRVTRRKKRVLGMMSILK